MVVMKEQKIEEESIALEGEPKENTVKSYDVKGPVNLSNNRIIKKLEDELYSVCVATFNRFDLSSKSEDRVKLIS